MAPTRSSRKSSTRKAKTASRASRATAHASGSSTSTEETVKQHGEFIYILDWDNVPIPIISALDSAEGEGEIVEPDVLQKLQTWLAEDLFLKYEEFKETYIVRTKTPGIQICRSVTTQVTNKYKNCLKVFANGIQLDDGYSTFLNKFSHMMEHKGRKVSTIPRQVPKATLASGTVVVGSATYNPTIDGEEITSQNEMKEELIDIFHTTRESQWPLQQIDRLMHQTYALQRMDIVACSEVIETSDDIDEDEDDPVNTENTKLCIEKLKAAWPFLFQPKWQTNHYLQLATVPIDIAIRDFIEQHLDLLIDFLSTSSTDTAIKCLVIKKKWEEAKCPAGTKFMMVIKMIAFYFQEETKCFFVPAERTTLPSEINLIQGMSGAPTIVALNKNIFLANKFYICIDQQVILEVYSSEDAMQAVIQSAFIFSTHYPACLQHTFEYIERVICKLGSSSPAQPLRVMTPIVLKLVNGLRKFQERYNKLKSDI